MINDRNDCFFNFERIAGISCFLKNRKSNGHVIKIPYHIFKQLITIQISLVHKIFILSINSSRCITFAGSSIYLQLWPPFRGCVRKESGENLKWKTFVFAQLTLNRGR